MSGPGLVKSSGQWPPPSGLGPRRAPKLGLVQLVGAGPGDPDLITVRGARALGEADAIVHDRLVPHTLLNLARPGTLRIDAGKRGHGESVDQATTTELLIHLARAGMRVVRLKGGDPFVFGRGGEEALALRGAGIPFEVVPGVTAGVAGPAFAGIPVTHRGMSRGVAFVTAATADGSARDGRAGRVDWSALSGVDTLVVFMAARAAAAVGADLVAAGRSAATPVAVVIAASTPQQEVRGLSLGALAENGVGEPNPGARPTLIVVGDVAALADELAWFEPSLAPEPAGTDNRERSTPSLSLHRLARRAIAGEAVEAAG
jgi:uroporphyrin-III C-methyltransferase